MAVVRKLSVSNRNLIWLAVVIVGVVVGWLIGGWKVGVAVGAVVLIVSEIVERRARRSRSGAS